MTTNKLLSEVSALGFEDTLDLDDTFIRFANLAHTSICVEFGEARRLTVTRASIAQATVSADEYFITVDLSRLANDFMMPISMPEARNGVMIPGAFVSGAALTLPRELEGDVFLLYKRKPKEISAYTANEEIDIPAFCTHLLPLLTAAYLWLDDAPDNADYYMDIYRRESTKLRRAVSPAVGAEYTNVTGWA